MQNALPNMLLSIVVFSTNIYYRDSFEAGIAVNVTCLLAMSGNVELINSNIFYCTFEPFLKVLNCLSILHFQSVKISQTS